MLTEHFAKTWTGKGASITIKGLPKTSKTKLNAAPVFVDKLTKMVHLAPCKTYCTAAQTAHLLNKYVIAQHEVLVQLVSDRDPRFMSAFCTELCAELNMKPRLVCAFHPQSDGQTERMGPGSRRFKLDPQTPIPEPSTG